MMNILAIDASSPYAAVAVCRDQIRLGQVVLNGGNTHSETLLPAVSFLLKTLGMEMDEISLFAVAAGPGSFTGVRIGCSTVKGLAFGKGKPCVPVSTLAALAENIREMPEGSILCPVMDARRQSVYNALFTVEKGELRRLTADRHLSIAELKEELGRCYAGKTVFLTGDGYEKCFPQLTGGDYLLPSVPQNLREPSAYGVATVAAGIYASAADRCSFTDSALAPIYLSPSQAERERTEKSAKLNGD